MYPAKFFEPIRGKLVVNLGYYSYDGFVCTTFLYIAIHFLE